MSTVNSAHEHAHHFDSLEHQHEAGKLGVWLFLATEILMFGGLFVGYIIYHGLYPDLFAAGASQLSWKLGALNTVVLITSSYTMAAGVHHAQKGDMDKLIRNLIITIACGLMFMVVKYFEYSAKISHGMLPGGHLDIEAIRQWSPAVADLFAQFGVQMGVYFSFYFCMTGLHGSHVLVGMGLMVWLIIRAKRGDFSSENYTAVEGVGLFWHLVDLIWIYLFPLLYLVG